MPEKVDRIPGAWSASLPWNDMANGDAWIITAEELAANNTKLETIRVHAHTRAKELGVKFRTKVVDGNLYLQATPLPATPTPKKKG